MRNPGARAIALALAAASCGTEPVAEVIALDVAHIAPTVTCVATDGAMVRGAAADGALWLSAAGAIKTVGLDGTITTPAWSVAETATLYPTSATAAAAIIDGEVWTVDEGVREFVPTPRALGAAAALCGPPRGDHGAFVATAGGLIERAAGLWWQWSPSRRDSFGALRELARIDGACAASDDAVWLTATTGELWRITRDDADVVAGTSVAVDGVAIVPGEGAAVQIAGELTIGPPWHDVRFELGAVAHVASGGDRLWAVAGGATFVRDAGVWAQVDGLPGTPSKIWPDAAGGAWFEVGAQVCRAALTPAIHVTGLAPYEQRVTPLAQLRVVPPAAETAVTVERDGAVVATATVIDGVAAVSDVDLGAGGWHDLTIRAGTTARRLEYNLLDISDRSWVTDVQPVFTEFCGGTRCHGPTPSGGRVDLSTYEGWRMKASRIRERLLRGEMPPSGPRPDSATIDIIVDWIEGGMKP